MIYHNIKDDGIVDDVAIERVLSGHSAALTGPEKLEVIRRGIMRDGLSISELEERLGLKASAVRGMVRRYAGVSTVAEFLGPEYERAAVRRAREKFEGLPPDITRWHKWHSPEERERNAQRRAANAA